MPPADQARVAAASALVRRRGALARFATILDDRRCSPDPSAPRSCSCSASPGCRTRSSGRRPSTCTARRPRRRSTRSGSCRPARSTCSAPGRRSRSGCATTCPTRSTSVLYATPDDLRLDVAKATEAIAGPEATRASRCPCRRGSATARSTLAAAAAQSHERRHRRPQSVDVNVRADGRASASSSSSSVVGGCSCSASCARCCACGAAAGRGAEATDAATAGSDDADAAGGEQPTDPGVEPTATAVARNATDAGEGQR